MKHKWLAEGLADGMDVEHNAAAVADQSSVKTEAGKADDAKGWFEDVKKEAEKQRAKRAELAEADPETHAVERDQHNNPVKKPGGTRKQRRARTTLIKRAVRRYNKAAKRRRKR